MEIFGLTLPNGQYLPPQFPQFSQTGSVALHIPLELLIPECRILLWSGSSEFAGVPVPKTTMNENYLLVSREYQVRCSR
jgi:hypothetical protein